MLKSGPFEKGYEDPLATGFEKGKEEYHEQMGNSP